MRLGKQRHESKYLAVKYFYEEKQWSINWMCRQLNISRAAYYKDSFHHPQKEKEIPAVQARDNSRQQAEKRFQRSRA